MSKGEKNSLAQITENSSHEEFLDEGLHIYLVGINFHETEKSVDAFEWEKVERYNLQHSP